jgi:hypothetical protein
MKLSVCMRVTDKGVLIYIGDGGKLYEVMGGKDGEINLSAL